MHAVHHDEAWAMQSDGSMTVKTGSIHAPSTTLGSGLGSEPNTSEGEVLGAGDPGACFSSTDPSWSSGMLKGDSRAQGKGGNTFIYVSQIVWRATLSEPATYAYTFSAARRFKAQHYFLRRTNRRQAFVIFMGVARACESDDCVPPSRFPVPPSLPQTRL